MDVARFKNLPVMGILRGIEQMAIEPLINIIVASGMQTIEIAMNTTNAACLIKKAVKLARGKLTIGAGTILNLESLKTAQDAGATFVVMPTFVKEVAQYCVKFKIPFFPGALTPSEIHAAWCEGATMVKVFPSGIFGPVYFSYLKGPFPEIELMAVGGVRQDNIPEYFAKGASALAVGSSMFDKNQIKFGNFQAIEKSLTGLVEKVKASAG